MKNLSLYLLLFLLSVLAVENVFAAPLKIPRYAKFEASFTLPDQTGNPFDPQANDVDVAFTGPHGGYVLLQPVLVITPCISHATAKAFIRLTSALRSLAVFPLMTLDSFTAILISCSGSSLTTARRIIP
jgi:hypothetical protein